VAERILDLFFAGDSTRVAGAQRGTCDSSDHQIAAGLQSRDAQVLFIQVAFRGLQLPETQDLNSPARLASRHTAVRIV
jgi:hypothetical protein